MRVWAIALGAVIACHGGSQHGDDVVDAVACDGAHGLDSGSGCTGSALSSCANGVEACGSNEQCIECLRDAECAEGPDPIWDGCKCVCADTPEECQFTFCCALDAHWDKTLCMCVLNQ